MTKRRVKDVAASVRARLQANAKETGRPFQEVLQYFAMERFLFRLSQSQHAPATTASLRSSAPATEAATVEQARFHVVERSLDFAFRLRPPRTASPRPVAVVRGERQEARVVDRLLVFPPRHDHLHVVVQARRRQALQVVEGAECAGRPWSRSPAAR